MPNQNKEYINININSTCQCGGVRFKTITRHTLFSFTQILFFYIYKFQIIYLQHDTYHNNQIYSVKYYGQQCQMLSGDPQKSHRYKAQQFAFEVYICMPEQQTHKHNSFHVYMVMSMLFLFAQTTRFP